jgi:hypothetical protein
MTAAMTRPQFLAALALTRNKWTWHVDAAGHLRTIGWERHCPLTGTAAFQGLGEHLVTAPMAAGHDLGLLSRDIVDTVCAADREPATPDLLAWRGALLTAVGLEAVAA